MSDITDIGYLPEGLVIPSFTDIRASLVANVRSVFGLSVRADSDKSIIGQILAILSEAFSRLWEQLQAVDSAADPDKATGAGLDALCALTGTIRPDATATVVTLTLTGTPATLVPAGNLAAAASTNSQFATLADVTFTTLVTWANATLYVVGDRVTNAGNAYQCTIGGSSASPGPSSTAADIVDGSAVVHWTYLGQGTAAADVSADCTVTGPVVAAARDVIVRSTSVGGWNSVINLSDGIAGQDVASDQELRVLRQEELSGDGTGTVNAILAALLKGVPDVRTVNVFENVTDAVDANGITPHAILALVDVTDDATHNQVVGDILLAQVSAGIATNGLTTVTSVDSQGVAHTINFSHPTEVPIFVDITLTFNAATYAGDAAVAAAIAAQPRVIGLDAIADRIGALAYAVPGVLKVPRSGSLGGCLIKTSAGPTSDADIVIDPLHVATYSSGNVTVHSSAGTP